MNKIWLLFLCGSLMASCSSDNDNPQIQIPQPQAEEYFVKFKLDGEEITLSDTTYSDMDVPWDLVSETSYFGGGFYDPAQVESMSFRIYSFGSLAVGTSYGGNIFQTMPEALGVYKNPEGKIYASTISSLEYYPFQIKVSSRSATKMEGTFEGRYKSISDAEILEITDGSFKIEIIE